jgi:hypothetical protein
LAIVIGGSVVSDPVTQPEVAVHIPFASTVKG